MKNIATAIRYFSDHLEDGIVNEIGDASDPWAKRLRDSVLPAVQGTKIVMIISLLERAIIDTEKTPPNTPHIGSIFDKINNLGFKQINSELDELSGLFALRHCFAHEFGKITDRQSKNVRQFYNDLLAGKFLDEKGNTVKPYFNINGDIIELLPGIENRLRMITWHIVDHLEKCGLDI